MQQQLQAKEHQKCKFENLLADSNEGDQQLIIDQDDSADFDYSPSQTLHIQSAKVKTSIWTFPQVLVRGEHFNRSLYSAFAENGHRQRVFKIP